MALAAKSEPTRRDVREMQKLLNSLDYDTGKTDGIFYRKTAKGFAAFLKNNPEKIGELSGWILERLMFQGQRQSVMEIVGNNPAIKSGFETRLATANDDSAPDARRTRNIYNLILQMKPAPRASSNREPASSLSQAEAEHSKDGIAMRNYAEIRIQSPVPGYKISDRFRQRSKGMHRGTDYSVPYGHAVKAAAGGVVLEVKRHNGYGNSVKIGHGNGVITYYAHLSRINVRDGESVSAGQTIARSGKSGGDYKPHLHFETWIRNQAGRLVAIDPEKIMGKNLHDQFVRKAAISDAHAKARNQSPYAKIDYPAAKERQHLMSDRQAHELIAKWMNDPTCLARESKETFRTLVEMGYRDELIKVSDHAKACLRQNTLTPRF